MQQPSSQQQPGLRTQLGSRSSPSRCPASLMLQLMRRRPAQHASSAGPHRLLPGLLLMSTPNRRARASCATWLGLQQAEPSPEASSVLESSTFTKHASPSASTELSARTLSSSESSFPKSRKLDTCGSRHRGRLGAQGARLPCRHFRIHHTSTQAAAGWDSAWGHRQASLQQGAPA